MNEIIIKDKQIENMIFEVRGVQVMLSSDVATLYQIETKRLNQVIKRNIDRFPSTFCFQLTVTKNWFRPCALAHKFFENLKAIYCRHSAKVI